jgi:CheY-like chemotaxis protein
MPDVSKAYPCPRILIVEDETIIAMDIRFTLKSMGFIDTTVVSTGEESIAAAATQNPDLVLMDISLKGEMDGVSAAEHINGRLGIPIIFLTAFGDPRTLGRINRLHRFGYLNKPYTESDLQTTILETLLKFPPGQSSN